jgi:hypothetical protein
VSSWAFKRVRESLERLSPAHGGRPTGQSARSGAAAVRFPAFLTAA